MMNDRVPNGDALNKALPKITSVEFVVAFAGVAVLLTLLYATQMIFSPFVLAIALFIILYPLRTYTVIRNIMGLALAIFILWFMRTIELVLIPFCVAMLIAYLLHPLVTRCEQWRVPRWVSTLLIILFFIAVFIMILVGVVPLIVQQFGNIIETFTTMTAQFSNWFMGGSVFRTLHRYGVSNVQLRDVLTETFAPRVQDVLKRLLQGAFGLVNELEAVVTGIVNIVIIPFLTFFLLKDFPLVKRSIKMLVPSAHRDEAAIYYHHVDVIVGRYLRGSMIIAVFDAVMVSSLFTMIGIQNALVIGVISGFLTFLPYFGLMTMLVITTIATTLSPDNVLLHFATGVCVVGGLHIIETYMLAPKIIGDKIGLHPVMLILSLFVFGYFLGFLGLLIAVPTAGSIMVIVKEWRQQRIASAENSSTIEHPIDAGAH